MTDSFVGAARCGCRGPGGGRRLHRGHRLDRHEIGELAADRILTLHELSPLRGSLEDAFMELTHDAVEFRTASPTPIERKGPP